MLLICRTWPIVEVDYECRRISGCHLSPPKITTIFFSARETRVEKKTGMLSQAIDEAALVKKKENG